MLTKKQFAVSNHTSGHALIRAVAGSGKTTTIVALVKNLIEKGVKGQTITFVVFNRDAKEDISKKLLNEGVPKENMPKVHTFHSLAYQIYKFLSIRGLITFNRLETNENFIKKFALSCLNNIKTKQENKASYATKDEAEQFVNFIDIAKATLLSTADAFDQWVDNKNYKHFIEAFELFEERRVSQSFITFSDLIKDVVITCHKNPHAKELVTGYVDYLVMDEVQDINEISIELAKLITSKNTNWVMVGDIDQCIYSWRGADPDYLAHKLQGELKEISSDKDIIEYDLPETFRYGHLISLISNHVVSKNKRRSGGICVSSNSAEETRFNLEMYNQKGRFGKEILEIITKAKKDGYKLQDIAVLVRLYSFSSEIELELLKNNIPYQLEGGSTVFNRREINALITLLKISNKTFFSQSDEECSNDLNDLFSLCFSGVKIAVDEKSITRLRSSHKGIQDYILSFANESLTKFKKNKIIDLATSISAISNNISQRPDQIIKTFIKYNEIESMIQLFSVKQEDADNKIYSINTFISFIKELSLDTSRALKRIAQLANIKNSEIDRLTISSIHRAKGREWPVVIIPGLEDGLFPYTKKDVECDIESERRLFYVAITRCIKHLYLVCPREIDLIYMMQGKSAFTSESSLASRFIYECKPYHSNEIVENQLDSDNPEYRRSPIAKSYIDLYQSIYASQS